MSNQIDTAFVKQFSANVFHLSQQQGSRLQMATRNEMQTGEAAFYDRIGAVTAQEITSRHADTPQIDTPHSRRRVTLVDSNYADLVDKADKVRMLLDPTSQYLKSFKWALGRKRDDQIIEKALGSAYGGKEGGTEVVLPDSQKLVATDGSDTSGVNLNVQTLRNAKKKLDAQEVDESIARYIAHTSSQEAALLGETEVTSSDFNTIRALVNGDVDSFVGFKFIRTERLNVTDASETFVLATGELGAGETLAAGARRCFAWAQDGLLSAIGMNPIARITERDDKNYSMQVYVQQAFGATRMEEVKVVEILCNES